MNQFSFGTRLLIVVWLLLLLALVPVFTYYGQAIGDGLTEETRENAVRHLDLVAWLAAEAHGFPDRQAFNAWATELGKRMDTRITYIINGQVIADSNVPYDQLGALEDHSTRPEVLAAQSGTVGSSVRYSHTLGKNLIYVARLASGGVGGLPPGVLRLAVPVSEVKARQEAMTPRLLGFLALVFTITMGIGLVMTRRLTASISELARAAQAIGAGKYSERIRAYPGKEFKPLADSINTMAKNISAHITSIEEKKGELEAVFNGMAEGVMVLGADGRIESWNKALADIITDIGRYHGKKPLEATMKPELQKAVDALIASPVGTERMRTTIDTADNRNIQVVLEPFRDMKGVHKIILVFHDITELKRLETVRRDFVANVSHELKTPVTSIKGFTETLLDSPSLEPDRRRHFLEIILRNADHMDKMVRDLLSLSKLDYKGDKPELTSVRVAEPLGHAVKLLEYVAEDKRVRLAHALPDDLRALGTGDGLHEVFRNLLENALTHSPQGGEVVVSVTQADGLLTFQVRDQGPGVPKASRERIFERFYRLGGKTTGKTGSSGLGLAICRHIVHGFGGRIWVESPADPEAGTGAAFFFTMRAA